MTLLKVQDLTIARVGSDAAIVRAASFALEPGETLGIAGESGCGKSTLLLALMGVVKPGLAVTGGQVDLLGQTLGSIAPEALRRLRGRLGARGLRGIGQCIALADPNLEYRILNQAK